MFVVTVHGFNGSGFKVIIMKKVFESVSNKEFIRFLGYVM